MTRPGAKQRHKRRSTEVDRYAADRVRYERNVRGISQSALADHLGLTFQQVQKYENGKNRMTVGRLADIAEFFGIPIQAMLPVDTTMAKEERADPGFVLASSRGGLRLAAALNTLPNDLLRSAVTTLVEAINNSLPETD